MIPIILISTFIVSLISISGILIILKAKKKFDNIISYFMPFAAGTMLAAAFFDIIPKSMELMENSIIYVFSGILLFFVIERYIHWHHCRLNRCKEHHKKVKPYVYLNLIGDGLHNFLDGVIIAASYMTDMKLGMITTFAIISHEIPQELGDASILLYGGLYSKKVLIYNFISALFAFFGSILAIIFQPLSHIIPFLLSIAAGGFIYLSLADIMPEISKEEDSKNIIIQTLLIFLGILMIYLLTGFLPE